jgi:hypothetical protein
VAGTLTLEAAERVVAACKKRSEEDHDVAAAGAAAF